MSGRAAIAVALVIVCAPAASAETVAFTLSSIPLQTDGETVYVLDEGMRITAELGAGLPRSPKRALAEVQRRLNSRRGRQHRERIEAAAAGNVLAARLGIERLPAVVVDERFVVYGVRDLQRARRLVRVWRAENGAFEESGTGSGTAQTNGNAQSEADFPPPLRRPPHHRAHVRPHIGKAGGR